MTDETPSKELTTKEEHGKGIRDFPQQTQNPFLDGIFLRTRDRTITARTGKQLALFDHDTGEELDESVFLGVRQRVDRAEFVKVFKAGLREWFNLSQKAFRVLNYLMDATKVGEHRIFFSIKEAKEFTRYSSHVTIQEALAELLEKRFIARTPESNLYYINPQMFFNGDRVVMLRDYVRKGSKTDRLLLEQDRRQVEAQKLAVSEPPLPLIGGGLHGSKEKGDVV
jgi:hypothetical protein